MDLGLVKQSIGVIVLAGGSSSRMGRPKQLLPFQGKTFIEGVLDKIIATGLSKILVVTGAYNQELTPVIPASVMVVQNRNWRDGMGTSIGKGVRELMAVHPSLEALMIVLSDQPLITTAHYTALIETFIEKEQDAVGTNYRLRIGVPALFVYNTFHLLKELKEDVGAKRLLNTKLKNVTGIGSSVNVLDIDNEMDYKKLLSL
ncbi:nucleotidyltransferase family protein [Aquimarina sp. U1-2]|uniref:nucleotidyltransferase family protein n=1 Tax=Aquimarina sp. U1-2 TaxID=2823141 RepID=UPI001FF063C3|nr:nucleotidyltransferase family protein [Aquimarina sp. U1-2]MBP2831237.1 nucleotidyltransferase family protein [Aquimarina sp. U1-2]